MGSVMEQKYPCLPSLFQPPFPWQFCLLAVLGCHFPCSLLPVQMEWIHYVALFPSSLSHPWLLWQHLQSSKLMGFPIFSPVLADS
ncbi:hypothetical protein FKM82_019391 [Ascaphus truei]